MKSSEETFVITKGYTANQQAKEQPAQRKRTIYETPLSSRQGGSSITKPLPKNLGAKPKQLTEKSYAITDGESSHTDDSVFRAPMRPVRRLKIKNKISIAFDDLNTDDEAELPIHRAKHFPSWCLSRNLKQLTRQQSYVNIDGE